MVSMGDFRTVILYDEEIHLAVDLRRFVLRRITVTTVLKTVKNIKKNKKMFKCANVNTAFDVKKQHNQSEMTAPPHLPSKPIMVEVHSVTKIRFAECVEAKWM